MRNANSQFISDHEVPADVVERDELIPGTTPAVRGGPLKAEELAELRTLIEKHGAKLGELVGMSRSTLTAMGAGLTCRTGSVIQYRQGLAAAKANGAL